MTAFKILRIWDYVVITLTMVISVAIGFYFRFTGTRQKTTNEFLMAGRSMKQFPAIFSLVVTKLSAIAIVGEPSDVYMYGTQRCIAFIFIFIGSFVTAYLYLPVYFAVGASTIYEYLDHRFGARMRKMVSVLCYIQTLLNMSVVIYTPAIALSAVTEFSTSTSIFLVGGVCILLSSTGGLKAVMWADVFQAALMYGCLFTLLTQAVIEAGGPSSVYKSAYDGERMEFFKFNTDPDIPYTFWNSISYGIQFGIAHAVNQMEVQRLLAVKDLQKAQSASLWTSIPSFVMAFLTTSAGLALYAVFKNCNPLSEESGVGLTKPDQIVPYFVVSRLNAYPGLPGLCISGILCASISSMSSAINSLSTVFVDDFIKVYLKQEVVSKLKLNVFAKVLVAFHGIAIVGLAFVTSAFKSVLQGVVVLDGIILGPTLGLYTLGILTRTANEMGALIGIVSGALLSGWIGLGSSFYGTIYPGKPLGTIGCNDSSSWNQTFFDNSDITTLSSYTNITDPVQDIFPLYRISYMWTYCIGALCTFIIGLISSFLIGLVKEQESIDLKLVSPITRFWSKSVPKKTDIPLKEEVYTRKD